MSGMLRNFEHTYCTTKKYILDDKNFDKTDIFFHGFPSNNDFNNSTKLFCEMYKPLRYKIEGWNNEIKNSIIENTDCINWENKAMKEYPYHSDGNLLNVMSAWRCRYLANKLKIEYEEENNFKYDVVYNLRTDWFVFDYIESKKAKIANTNKNFIFIPNYWDHKSIHPLAVGDIMAFGSSHVMNQYYSLYLFAKNYKDQGVLGHAETILGAHIKNQKLIRKFCRRNVNREYPYSNSPHDYLWKNWDKKDLLKQMHIDDKFLKKLDKKSKGNIIVNLIKKFILRLKEITLIYYLLKFIYKFLKIKTK